MDLKSIHVARRAYDKATDEIDRARIVRSIAVHFLSPVQRDLHEELVSIVGEDGFWKEHKQEISKAVELLINTDARPADQRIEDAIYRSVSFCEPVVFTDELAAAVEIDDILIRGQLAKWTGDGDFWKKHWRKYIRKRATEIGGGQSWLFY